MTAKYRYGSFLCSVATGAALMWLLDPLDGGRRRALVRDRGRWLGRKTREMTRAVAQNVASGADRLVTAGKRDQEGNPALHGATRSGFGTAFRPARWSPTTRALAGGAVVAGAAVALSMTRARARRRRLEAELPPPF